MYVCSMSSKHFAYAVPDHASHELSSKGLGTEAKHTGRRDRVRPSLLGVPIGITVPSDGRSKGKGVGHLLEAGQIGKIEDHGKENNG